MTNKIDKNEAVMHSEKDGDVSEVLKDSPSLHEEKRKNHIQRFFHTLKDFLKNHKITTLGTLLLLSVFLNLLFSFWIHEMKEHSPKEKGYGNGRGMNAYSYTSYTECFRGECFHQTVENGKPSPTQHFHADDFSSHSY